MIANVIEFIGGFALFFLCIVSYLEGRFHHGIIAWIIGLIGAFIGVYGMWNFLPQIGY